MRDASNPVLALQRDRGEGSWRGFGHRPGQQDAPRRPPGAGDGFPILVYRNEASTPRRRGWTPAQLPERGDLELVPGGPGDEPDQGPPGRARCAGGGVEARLLHQSEELTDEEIVEGEDGPEELVAIISGELWDKVRDRPNVPAEVLCAADLGGKEARLLVQGIIARELFHREKPSRAPPNSFYQ